MYVVMWMELTVDVGSAISLLRSASENYQDYIPVWISVRPLMLDTSLLSG